MTLSLSPLSPYSHPHLQHFSSRALLPLTPESLWKIEAGFVRSMTWLEDGTAVVLGIWGGGEIIGKPFSSAEPYRLECITKVEATPLAPFNLDDPSEALSEGLSEGLSKALLVHVHQFEALMQIRSYKRVDIMLLKFLSWLAERFGQDVAAGRMINLRLTHQDIAESIGATRVTVTRMLNQLEQQGVIQRLSLQRIILREEELWHYEI